MRTLVIAEKFNTALRIAIVLSDGRMQRLRIGGTNVFRFERSDGQYAVVGLRGHIVELDYPPEFAEWNLASLGRLLETEPLKRVTELGIVGTLQEIVREYDRVIIATDFDREGELIGAEALELLQKVHPNIEVKRARYSALTREEIEQSFANLASLDHALAEAAEARQEIDLVWGALLTRFLSIVSGQRGKSFLSAGRVQTPTLALLVDRDQEIKEFVPQPFFLIEADVTDGKEGFTLAHQHGRFDVRAEAEKVFAKVEGSREGRVEAFLEEPTRRRPPVPFSTTLFVSEATRQGLGAAYAMRIAEDLYTQGLISYPRTDNTVYPRGLGLRALVERFKEGPFKEAAEFVLAQETLRASRGRSETTDHPPIYPTGVTELKKLKADHAKVYELVVRRFLATVAPDSTGLARTTTVDIRGEKFDGKGQILVDPGWYRIYPYATPEQSPMPTLSVGQTVEVRSVTLREDQTRPPKRFTQGTLIQEMERLGLGTKSTRHDVLQKLFDRHYVQQRSLEPTVTGIAVTEALKAHAPLITRPEMTHRLEEEMELVAESKKEKAQVLKDSRDMLREAHELLTKNAEGVRETLTGALDKQHFVGPCALCGGALRLARSPRGARWVQCVNNPGRCTATFNLPSAGFIEPAPEFLCGVCKVPRLKITFRGQRPDLYCINPECTEHHRAFRIGVCPSCASPLEIRYSFLGKRFVGCSGYPTCRVTYPLPQRGKLEKDQPPCPVCRAPVVTAIEAGRPPWTLCVNPECPTRQKVPKAKAAGAIKPRAAKRKARAAPRATSAPPPTGGTATTPVASPAKPKVRSPARRVRRPTPAPVEEAGLVESSSTPP
ncbi:MAG: DNA topoisomerase I [Thermoplasmata archaeon]|nr:DNA topoisomerase I [Thermoplasmata archaeon]MCI4359950.1 DNA topoisomerase I [Thermoplasmata archaeon]